MSNPTLLQMPLAVNGDKNTIPVETGSNTGLFSQKYGFQSINSLPLSAGGKAISRHDYNGAMYLLSNILFYAQKGYTFEFDSSQAYYANCEVIDTLDGNKYRCIADVAAEGDNPSEDFTHWQRLFDESEFFYRLPNTAYALGDVKYAANLPSWGFLICTTSGVSDSTELTIPTGTKAGDFVTDGTVTWQVASYANMQTALAESTGYGIVSGGAPSISGLVVTVASGIVHLPSGARRELAAQTVSLAPADTTNPRIDLVYLDQNGDALAITGTASASPSAPALPMNGISVAQVSVAANATTGTLTDMRGMLARWYNAGVVNVKDFGAVGDGITNDTAAVQNALNQGGVVYFPKGKYRVTAGLTVNKLTLIKGDIVQNYFDKIYNWNSEDNISEIFFDTTATSTLFTCNATTGFCGLFFNSNSAYFTTHQGQAGYEPGSKTLDQEIVINNAGINGVDISGAPNADVWSCKFNGFSGFAIKTGVCQDIHYCEFNNCNDAVKIASTDGTIVGCKVHHCQNGIDATSFNFGRILACRIEWIGEYGIYINSGSDIQIKDCLIDRCGYAGISTDPTESIWGLDIDSDVRRCGCCYRGVNFGDIASSDEYEKSSNIVLNNVSYFSVKGNNIISTAYDDGTGGNVPALGIYVGYNTFYGEVLPNWVGTLWGANNQKIALQHAQGVAYNNGDSLVINDKSNVNTPFVIVDANSKTITVNGAIKNTRYTGSITGNSGTINIVDYLSVNQVCHVKVKASSYNTYGAFAEYVVSRAFTSAAKFNVAAIYAINSDASLINLNASVNDNGVLTLENTVTSSGGVTINYEISFSE